MEIFCIEEFKSEFDKLKRKKSYSTLEKDFIDYFFNKTVDQLKTGSLLNNNHESSYIKKRINGSGGFRFYYLIIIKDNKLYLMFIPPKAGTHGSSNIKDKAKTDLYKKVYEDIKSNNLYKLELSSDNKLSFINQEED